MTPTTSPTDTLDHLDPWGFGRGDDRTAVIEYFEPLDEPVDDDEPILVTLPVLPAPAVSASVARVAAPTRPAPHAEVRRLPFPGHMVGVLALFAAVIVAQAFYIGFSLTGEASARPASVEVVVAPRPTGTAARVGALSVDTGATPAQVLIDGALVGSTPFTRADLAAGEHAVRVEFTNGASVDRTVAVAAGETLSLVFEAPPRRAPTTAPASAKAVRAAAPAAPAPGWVRVDAPFEVQVFRAGELVGSSRSARIELPAGSHALELVNTALGYRGSVRATVVADTLVPLAVDTPRAPVAINAQPWAEVIVDGRVHGDTPLANVMLPIGVHDIVLRHPEFGEHTETVTVRATGANRVSADLRR